MTDIDALFGATTVGSDAQLSRVRQLLAEESDLQDAKASAEAMLADASTRLNEIKTQRLPEALNAAGVTRFTDDTGIEVKLEFSADGALGSPKNEEEAAERERKLDVIIEHGGDEIVKMSVILEFPKERFHEAEDYQRKVAAMLAQDGMLDVGVSRLRTVHPMTLKKWVKEKMERGDQLPLDDLGLWYGQVARIKRPVAKS